MSQPQEMHQAADVDEVALAWLARVQGNLTGAERTLFNAWLGASPAHRNAYRRAEMLWSTSVASGARVADEQADALSVHLVKIKRIRANRRATKRAAIVAGLLAIGVLGAAYLERPHILQDLRADYVSPRGKREQIRLQDGSTVLLDADSALVSRFTAGERRVELLRGAGFFSVEKANIPFVVDAGGGEVKVIGTRFDVRLSSDEAVVTVERGKVAVDRLDQQMPTMLEAGQQVSFGNSGMGDVVSADLDETFAWHTGRYVFYQARFADVVRELARYYPGRIIVLNPALSDKTVTGSFSLDDSISALESLQSTVGFQVHSFAGRLVVLR
jgi:transmembrane sensor